ncbi:hypothetical protein BLEM_2292 [Bifidobacterium lemurum]|uniref:Uncharacterized protein n=1 Tax=Bifidobacterium lemurum TaxID=1603886 RepID=A0A261FJC0_9BIFI|nr:hypothetical protein [Bifidobacterium lemurum]OZG59257.1 hypothetical protein BLEM_2292 [Bifidobacterium lemurum]QOL33904.1 hypothetical protein BL8807_09065 [Bifidobacterium lemurum]
MYESDDVRIRRAPARRRDATAGEKARLLRDTLVTGGLADHHYACGHLMTTCAPAPGVSDIWEARECPECSNRGPHDLRGDARRIAWAGPVRDRVLAELELALERAEPAAEAAIGRAIRLALRRTDAEWWIEHRSDALALLEAEVMREAGRWMSA